MGAETIRQFWARWACPVSRRRRPGAAVAVPERERPVPSTAADRIMAVTPLAHDDDMRPTPHPIVDRPEPTGVDVDRWLLTGDPVGEHGCPICRSPVVDIYRPGRPRVYCTNACRQRAYRWRRAHGVRTFVERDGPAERLVNDRRHAARDGRDPVGALRDHRAREMTACGLFARTVRGRRVTHDRFVPEHPWSCLTCAVLIAAGPPGSGIPDVVRAFAAGLQSWPASPPLAGAHPGRRESRPDTNRAGTRTSTR